MSEPGRPLAVELSAVMKRPEVLGNAGLTTRTKTGRTVAVRLAPEPMRDAMNRRRRYERFWAARLDRLAACAEAEQARAGGIGAMSIFPDSHVDARRPAPSDDPDARKATN